MMNKIILLIKDYWGIIVSLLIMSVMVLYAYGCQPHTQSLIDPAKKVDVYELQNEIDALISLSEVRFNDLQRQAEFRDFVFNQVITIAESGTVNPVGILTSLLAVAGIGSTADNIRLRRQRKKGLPYKPTPKTDVS